MGLSTRSLPDMRAAFRVTRARALIPLARSFSAQGVPVPPLDGNAKRLSGKFVAIAGGTQGLGEAIAYACAKEGAAGVAVCGRSKVNGEQVAANLKELGT